MVCRCERAGDGEVVAGGQRRAFWTGMMATNEGGDNHIDDHIRIADATMAILRLHKTTVSTGKRRVTGASTEPWPKNTTQQSGYTILGPLVYAHVGRQVSKCFFISTSLQSASLCIPQEKRSSA